VGPHYTTQLEEWVVGFRDFGQQAWYTRLMKPGFRHCFAFTFDPCSGVWIVIDPTLDSAFIRAYSPRQFTILLNAYTAKQIKFLKVKAQRNHVNRPRLLLTCVSAVAHILGLKTSAVTPLQLYRYLLKIGSESIFEV